MRERIRQTLLIARQEFLMSATNRVFLVTLVLLPFMITVSALVPAWIMREGTPVPAIAVIDETGRLMERLQEELADRRARDELLALGRWVRLNLADGFLRDGLPDPGKLPLLFLKRGGEITLKDVAAFRAKGGLAGMLPIAMAFVRRDARPFLAPRPDLDLVALPAALASLSESPAGPRFRKAALPYLQGRKRLADGRRLAAIAVIPQTIGLLDPDDPALHDPDARPRALQLWSAGVVDPDAEDTLRAAVAAILREEALTRAGITPAIRSALAARLPLRRLDVRSHASHGRSPADAMRDILPRGFALVLIYFLLLQASLLMGHMAEEKQTRVLDVLISTVSPQTLLAGKLIGGTGLSLLSLVVLLTLAAFALRTLGPGEAMLLLRVVGDALADAGLLALLISQFLLGFLFFAGLFVVAGAFSGNQRTAQLLVMPLMLMLLAMMPVVIVLGQDPAGAAARIASYLPGIGPFMIVARAQTGLSGPTIVAASLLQIVYIAGVLWAAGRLFRLAVVDAGGLQAWKARLARLGLGRRAASAPPPAA